jgi:ABC-type glycerol-3-phosphate transport system substrate-binding protein
VIYATWGEVGPRESEHWSLLNFEKNYTDLRIDIITALDQASYVNRLEALISSGTDPDVMRVPGHIAHNIYARGAALPAPIKKLLRSLER